MEKFADQINPDHRKSFEMLATVVDIQLVNAMRSMAETEEVLNGDPADIRRRYQDMRRSGKQRKTTKQGKRRA